MNKPMQNGNNFNLQQVVNNCHNMIVRVKKDCYSSAEIFQSCVTDIMSPGGKIEPVDAIFALYPFIRFKHEDELKGVFVDSRSHGWEQIRHYYEIHNDQRFLVSKIKEVGRNREFLAFCLFALYVVRIKERRLEHYVELGD